LSQTPEANSEFPVIAGKEILWSEDVSNDYEVYKVNYDTKILAYTQAENLSLTDFDSKYPQTLLYQTTSGTERYTVWTEEIISDSLYEIRFDRSGTVTSPLAVADLGQTEPSIYTISRDTYAVYTASPQITVDIGYDSLVYGTFLVDKDKKQNLELRFFQETGAECKYKVFADNVPMGEIKVPSGELTIFSKWIPDAVTHDGEIMVRIKKTRGSLIGLDALVMTEYEKSGQGNGGAMTADAEISLQPLVFSLSQNYPNPFSSQTAIRYSLSAISHTTLKIYNVAGQVVKTLVSERQKPGYYAVRWNGKNENGNSVASGVYFYRLRAGDFTDTKKMIVLR
ncbi:MAG: FlgD immunoglobulin-like domain containing protein, partial [Candidatus Edwardsbacteria bacterium]